MEGPDKRTVVSPLYAICLQIRSYYMHLHAYQRFEWNFTQTKSDLKNKHDKFKQLHYSTQFMQVRKKFMKSFMGKPDTSINHTEREKMHLDIKLKFAPCTSVHKVSVIFTNLCDNVWACTLMSFSNYPLKKFSHFCQIISLLFLGFALWQMKKKNAVVLVTDALELI